MTQNIRSFREYHPAVLLLYCIAPIFSTMITTSRIIIALSILCGSLVGVFLTGKRAFIRALIPIVVLFLITVLFNFLTNHNGRIILFSIGHTRFTQEALLFGITMGGMLMGVFIWSLIFTKLISSECILALFGHRLPAVGMVFSMILKMVPETIRKYRELADSGKALGIGRAENQKGKSKRMALFRNSWRIIAALIGWVMEDSLDTAKAMRARGYGSGRRTHYAVRAFRRTDILALILIGCLLGVSLFAILYVFSTEALAIYGESQASSIVVWAKDGILIACYIVMLLYPIFIEGKDRVKLWALSR